MNRILMIAAVLLGSVVSAHANADPVTIESKWNEKTMSVTLTGVTVATVDVGGFGATGYAIIGNVGLFNGTDGSTYGNSSIISSTWSNVTAFDYSFLASGSTATVKIAQTIKTPAPRGTGIFNGNTAVTSTSTYNTPYPSGYLFTAPVISTSSPIIEPNGVLVTHTFRAQVVNPIFYFTNLSAAATYTLTVDYGVPVR